MNIKKIIGIILISLLAALISCKGGSSGGSSSSGGTTILTVTYNLNDGAGTTPVDSGTYTTGQIITIVDTPNDLVKTGYEFNGWTIDQGGLGTVYTQRETVAIGSTNVTFYAKWTAIPTHNVIYHGNGSQSGSVTDSTEYRLNDIVTVEDKGDLTKSGYTFIGWNTNSSATTALYSPGNTFSMGSADTNLYAIWSLAPTYTVTYDANYPSFLGRVGSVPVDTTGYLNGQEVIVINNTGNLAVPGHRFSHWNTADNGGGTSYYPGNPVTGKFNAGSSNVMLYAQWVPTYTVTYDENDTILKPATGSVPVDSYEYIENDSTPVSVLGNPGALARSGYTLDGWCVNADGTGTTYTSGNQFIMGNTDVILYAKWTQIPTYSVTYLSNGSTDGDVPVDVNYQQNATVTVLGNIASSPLVKTGYTFIGWNTKADGTGSSYLTDATFIMGNQNVNLYAQWSALTTYNVIYDGNNANNLNVPVDSNQYLANSSVTVLGNINGLVKTGYYFTGWNTKADGSGTNYAANDTFSMPSGNVILFAKWTTNPTYKVTYSGNGNTGGSVPLDLTNYENGALVTVADNSGSLVRTGYQFVSWNTAANGSGITYYEGESLTMGSANITLYAQWATAYTVTYSGNGSTSGSVPADFLSYLPSQNAVVLGNTGVLVKSGSSFTGWNSQTDGNGVTYVPGDSITIASANITLYAKWTINPTYTVTYAAGGGTGTLPVNNVYYEDGSVFYVMDNVGLVKSGSTFTGWSDGVETYTPGETGVISAANITLTAVWTTNTTYAVTYNANGATGGSVPVDSTAYENNSIVTVSGNSGNLTRGGYAFNGWNTAANGSGIHYAPGATFAMGTANIILYAQWVVGYTINYNGNGATEGSVPVDGITRPSGSSVTVLGNTGSLVNGTLTFIGWNQNQWADTATYTPGSEFLIGSSNVILYAIWTNDSTYSVTYDANGATAGSVPVDAGQYLSGATATALPNTGNLALAGDAFVGWNTSADGLGTTYAAGATFTVPSGGIILYAKWVQVRAWNAISGSSNGRYLAATVNNGQVWTSVDYGETWTERTTGLYSWTGVTMSNSGNNIAAVISGNFVRVSRDGGVSWEWTHSSGKWSSITGYNDGNNLVITNSANTNKKNFYYGTYGVPWTWSFYDTNVRQVFNSVTSSDNGSLLAATTSRNNIWISTNSGTSWVSKASARSWRGIAATSDGTKLAAVVTNGQIWVSSDSGATWSATGASRAWLAVDIVSNGTTTVIAAVVNGGQVWISDDMGATWSATATTQAWYSITGWYDPVKGHFEFAAVVFNGVIYTSDYSGGKWTWTAH